MKSVNFLGGGVVFELYTKEQIDEFVAQCRKRTEHAVSLQAA
jgi:hypothetical protein